MATATYRFIVPGRYIGQTVTVFDQATNAQVASGAVGSDGVYSVSLAQGDYYATTPDGRYVDADTQGAPSSDAANVAQAALLTTYAGQADALTLQRLDRQGLSKARTQGGVASIAYADATEFTADWSSLTGWQTAVVQVSGNRLYGTTGGNPAGALKAFSVAANEVAHIQSVMTRKAGGGGAFYFGIDTGTADHALTTSSPDGIFIGFSGAGNRQGYIGATSSGGSGQDVSTIGSNPSVDTSYLVTIDIDELWISLAIRALSSDNDAHTFRLARSNLSGAGKTINNIIVYLDDNRGLSGHSLGPIVAVKSRQQARTKTIGGQTIEGAAHRPVITSPANSGGDAWRYAIPASYDARKPSPLCLYFHQSLTGSNHTAWSETRMQPVTKALGDAGFIVAAANDFGDRWGNQASLDNYRALYEHLRDRFNVGPLFLLGISAGTTAALNALVRRKWVTPAAVATIGGVVNLDDLWANNTGTYAAGIRAAYGIAADGSDYASKTAGWNPAQRNGYEFRGAPMRFYTSTADTSVPKATNQDALAAKVLPYAPEANVVLGTGGHLDPSQFQASDLVSFFQTYA